MRRLSLGRDLGPHAGHAAVTEWRGRAGRERVHVHQRGPWSPGKDARRHSHGDPRDGCSQEVGSEHVLARPGEPEPRSLLAGKKLVPPLESGLQLLKSITPTV